MTASTAVSLVGRLRDHVRDRGGMSRDAETGEIVLPNGAWSMMLAAADLIEQQARELADLEGRFSFVVETKDAHAEKRFEAERALTATRAEIESLREALGANVKRADRYGVALMMINAGCSDPARFAGAILDDREPVNVELDEEDFDEDDR